MCRPHHACLACSLGTSGPPVLIRLRLLRPWKAEIARTHSLKLKQSPLPALQTSGRTLFGGVRAGGVARAPAADERGQARRGGWHGQGTDQTGAGRTGLAQAGFESGEREG